MKTLEKQHATITALHEAMASAIDSGELTALELPLEHYHTAGLYGRRIFVPGGTVVVTKVHKSEHITVALKGTCTVRDEHGGLSEISAPAVFVTRPGTHRAVYAHDDVEWLTVHACTEKDLTKIESLLVAATPEEADHSDYQQVLLEHNLTEHGARQISEQTDDLCAMPEGERLTEIRASSIEGLGVFATADIPAAGCYVGPVRLGKFRTPIGRYTNHSANPNCIFMANPDGGIDLYSIRAVALGDELTVCYRQACQTNLRASRFLEK